MDRPSIFLSLIVGAMVTGGLVAVVLSLMANPDLLILDEVSMGLSSLVVNQVYASLQSRMTWGAAIFLVEHLCFNLDPMIQGGSGVAAVLGERLGCGSAAEPD